MATELVVLELELHPRGVLCQAAQFDVVGVRPDGSVTRWSARAARRSCTVRPSFLVTELTPSRASWLESPLATLLAASRAVASMLLTAEARTRRLTFAAALEPKNRGMATFHDSVPRVPARWIVVQCRGAAAALEGLAEAVGPFCGDTSATVAVATKATEPISATEVPVARRPERG